MNEVFLLVVIIAFLILPQFFVSKLRKPVSGYIKIGAATVLLILVWIPGNDGQLSVKVVLSALVLSAFYKHVSPKKLDG